MKRVCTVGLCLVALFVLGAVAAFSSSAADLLARVAGGGSIAGVTFLSTGAVSLLLTKSGKLLKCKNVTSHGLFLSSTLGNILLRFLGCADPEADAGPCETIGEQEGEIHLPLSTLFHLGLAHLGTNRSIPAVVILPGKINEIICGRLFSIKIKGNLIGALQLGGAQVPLNVAALEVNLNFQQTATGEQHLRLILMPGSSTPAIDDWESSFAFSTLELSSELANLTLDSFRLSNGNLISLELTDP